MISVTIISNVEVPKHRPEEAYVITNKMGPGMEPWGTPKTGLESVQCCFGLISF